MNPKRNFQRNRHAAKLFLAATLLLSVFVFQGNGVAGTGRFDSQKTEQHFKLHVGSPRVACYKYSVSATQARATHSVHFEEGITPHLQICNHSFHTLFSRLSREHNYRTYPVFIASYRPRSATDDELLFPRG